MYRLLPNLQSNDKATNSPDHSYLGSYQVLGYSTNDLNNAFLNVDLHESVFKSQLIGFEDPTLPRHVCKIVKALYGHKKASMVWYDKLRQYQLRWGFSNTQNDTSLFYYHCGASTILLFIYVDDIFVTGRDA